ncbi:MAG: permease prefix domain 1-containing protein [Pseudomonadota bacterium]
MAERWQQPLAVTLRRGGMKPAAVRRLLRELSDHEADLRAAAVERGLSRDAACDAARRQLGDIRAIGRAALAQPALLRFGVRHGWWSPASPLLQSIGVIAQPVARWAAAGCAGALVTAATFFLLQLSLGLSGY